MYLPNEDENKYARLVDIGESWEVRVIVHGEWNETIPVKTREDAFKKAEELDLKVYSIAKEKK